MVHPSEVNTYTYTTFIGAVVVLVSISFIEPEPDEFALLIPVTEALDQENVVPLVPLVGVYPKLAPLQIAAGLSVDVKVGLGFTVTTTEYVVALVQLFALTVYIYVTFTGALVEFVNASLIDPEPVALAFVIPTTAARDHVNDAPVVLLVGVYTKDDSEQIDAGDCVDVKTGVGLTLTVTF